SDEVPQLLRPLHLDVLARRDDENAELRLIVTEQGDGAECDVGLPHPNFVREIGDASLFQDVVKGDGAFELLLCALAWADPGAEVQELPGGWDVDHQASPFTGAARCRKRRSNHTRKSGIPASCPSRRWRIAASSLRRCSSARAADPCSAQ